MTHHSDDPRIETGVRNLDAIFSGGIPQGSVILVAGAPGAGKTTLIQQICFHNATPQKRVLCFNTLSEPTAKTLRNLKKFSFFDAAKLKGCIEFVDLGVILRSQGLEVAATLIMEQVKKVKPAMVVIDSFKVFDEIAQSKDEFRKFGYELAVNLMAWETTAFLLGEYGAQEYENNPLFSIVDGLVVLSQREAMGERQRFFTAVKMRGTVHSRDDHAFIVTSNGLEVFAPKVAIRREPPTASGPTARCQTRIPKFDEILGPGIPWGSSLLLSGVAGTGKTVLSLEFIYRGAQAGEKGIFFSFEETTERLRATAQGLGWDIDEEIKRGMIEIVFIPQPDIMVEAHLLMIQERIEAMGAKRVVIDSVSVFLHKITEPQISREKIFHLCTMVQNAGAVGFFPTDIPYGSRQVSRFGVEETVVDGVIILTATEEGNERQRYVEVYKLRNTAHLKGRHNIVIGSGGVSIFPRYGDIEARPESPPPALDSTARLGSGVPGLDHLLGGGLLRRSVTLLSGSAGVGKSTLGLQFVLQGAALGEPALYVTLEEGPDQLLASADALGLPLRGAIDEGMVEILYVSREHIRAGQFLTVLTERLEKLKATRVVLDAATHMMTERVRPEEFRHVLYKLSVRFKNLGVTSIIMLESSSLTSTEKVTELTLSPIADNLLMLRYIDEDGRLAPTLTVVKTRGSSHDRETHFIHIAEEGLRIGAAVHPLTPPAREGGSKESGASKRSGASKKKNGRVVSARSS